MSRWKITALALTFVGAPLMGQEDSDVGRTRISGLAFGDAYWMAQSNDPTLTGENGFWLRRAYLTFDHDLTQALALRLRFEVNSAGDFTSGNKLEPFVKDLYARWTVQHQQFYIGISSTPTWGVIEKTWGYRSVEKTPLDLYKFGSSRDFGLAVKGRFDSQGTVRYHAMFGNGSGTKGETNQGKKGFLSLSVYPIDALVVELYADYESRPDENDRTTLQAFAAWSTDRGRVGVQVARQRRELNGAETVNLDVVSAFGVLKVHERASVLARYDRTFDPNPDAPDIPYLPMNPDAECNLVIAGLDLTLYRQFHLIPNVEAVIYDRATGEKSDTDVMMRLTFFVTF